MNRSAFVLSLVGSVLVLEDIHAERPNGSDELGRAVYTNCAACHGPEGQGGFAPAFAANERLQDVEYLLVHILNGSPVMPAFKDHLSNEEIAAVANHVRNNWGNRAARISAADVANVERRFEAARRPQS